MNKKLYTIIFVLISTVINVISTFLIIAILCTGDILLMRKVFNVEMGSTVFGTSLMIAFVIGLALSFFFYTRISTKIISKFHMDQKFEDKWIDRSKKKHGRHKKQAGQEDGYTYTEAQSEEETPRKTKLPSSVLPTDEEKEEAERWGE